MSQADPRQITTRDPVKAVKCWFALMERCCAAADYDAAERIFADDVVWFDINMEVAFGRGALRKREWEGVWDKISNFKFDLRNVHADGSGNRAWGAATWTSIGFDGNRKPFYRPGRSTAILERRGGVWLAVHIHFSLYPGIPHRSFGLPAANQPLPSEALNANGAFTRPPRKRASQRY